MPYGHIISRKDPISLANEIHKVLDNSGSDWPFHVKFSGNYQLVKGLQSEPTLWHVLNGRFVLLRLGRVLSKMNTYTIFDKQISEWLPKNLSTMSSNVWVTTFGPPCLLLN